MGGKFKLVLAFVCALSAQAHADSTTGGFYSNCSSDDAAKKAMCAGYILGFSEGHLAGVVMAQKNAGVPMDPDGSGLCIDPTISSGSLIFETLQSMGTVLEEGLVDPEDPVSVGVIYGLMHSFRCGK